MIIEVDNETEKIINDVIKEGYFNTPSEVVNFSILFVFAHDFSDSDEIDEIRKSIHIGFRAKNVPLVKESIKKLCNITGKYIIQ